jgi:AraC-like DNA-binding protein
LNESDIYREWAPPAEWQAMVVCLWEQRVGAERDQRVVPDGCADIIVGFGEPFAVGLADRAAVHRLAAGSACRGLRLRPEAVATFFGLPANELRNRNVALHDLFGTSRTRHLVETVVAGAPDGALTGQPPESVCQALWLLRRMPVEDVSTCLGLSSRQLRRLVLTHTGLGPKTYQRVARLGRFLADPQPLASAAVKAGYADQAHLSREVLSLCGVTPRTLRAS